MTLSFMHRLATRARAVDSLLCVGLDPHDEDLRRDDGAPATADDALAFCRALVAATRDVALAYKPNAAFFEALGADGVAALATLVQEIEPEIPVILDAKRGDIASTAAAYATAAYRRIGASAVTLHPLLGQDSVSPFLQDRDRGVFLLCRTSNPGAAELQNLQVSASEGHADAPTAPLYQVIAETARRWDHHGQIGLVVGATVPGVIPTVRRAFPEAWLLCPGVGAQGGDLAATVGKALRPDGLGLLVSVSRGISRAADPGAAAAELVAQVRQARDTWAAHRSATETPVSAEVQRAVAQVRAPASLQASAGGPQVPLSPSLAALADGLLDASCVQLGSFTLKSGLQSPIYLDLRRLSGHPQLLAHAADAYVRLLRPLTFDRLAALPYAGLPIGTAVALRGNLPLCFPRKEVKQHGMRAAIEGPFAEGETALVIDDLATRGTSALEALPKLRSAGLRVRDLAVLVDRESGARARLAAEGVALHAVFTLRQLITHWRRSGRIGADTAAEVEAFLAASDPTPGLSTTAQGSKP